jgi:hypothetical protein
MDIRRRTLVKAGIACVAASLAPGARRASGLAEAWEGGMAEGKRAVELP